PGAPGSRADPRVPRRILLGAGDPARDRRPVDRALDVLRRLRRRGAGRIRARGHGPGDLRVPRRRLRARVAPRAWPREVAHGGHQESPRPPEPPPLDPDDARCARALSPVRLPRNGRSVEVHGDRGPRRLPEDGRQADRTMNAPTDWWKTFFGGLAVDFW